MGNNAKSKKEEALLYHSEGRPGKIEVVPTKPYSTQKDLSLAYSPGVAEPCLAIQENPDDAYKYTAKGNLVAVISNGTAVLGLGDIGAMAGKPVMEGKGLLLETVRRHRRIRHRGEYEKYGAVHRDGQEYFGHLRRHQPRGHQGSRMFRDRGAPERGAPDPGHARRPARHGDHLVRRAAQCARDHR